MSRSLSLFLLLSSALAFPLAQNESPASCGITDLKHGLSSRARMIDENGVGMDLVERKGNVEAVSSSSTTSSGKPTPTRRYAPVRAATTTSTKTTSVKTTSTATSTSTRSTTTTTVTITKGTATSASIQASSISSSSIPAPLPTGPYRLVQSHSGSTFLNGWNFFTASDPTHGQVNFVNQASAITNNLTFTTSTGSTIMKVDDYSTLGVGQNRNSIRITSKEVVNINSIVILDAVRIPWGPSVWPAFWSVGPNWPNNGEIDIVEGVHNNVQNTISLHTAPNCTLEQPMQASGSVGPTNCYAYANGNTGCGGQDKSSTSFGSGFNGVGGGVYAMSWNTTGIAVWLFNKGNVPADIQASAPAFSNWGEPRMRFGAGTCDMNKYFSQQTLVFDITLCGDWAGNTYSQAGFNGTCSQAVQNPANYHNAVWEVNSVKVYAI